MSLSALFVIAFVSATLLPGSSEIYLSYLVLEGKHNTAELLLAATAGNSLGAMTNFLIGWTGQHIYRQVRHQDKKHQLANRLIQKYSYGVLLLSWLPLIGDILCLLAGWYQLNWFKSFIAIIIGKSARYLMIIILAGT